MMKKLLNLFFFAPFPRSLRIVLVFAVISPATTLLRAQDPKQLITAVVDAELAADRTDHSAYQYYDHDVTPDHDTLYYVVETPAGNLRKKMEDHGHPLSADERQQEDQRIQNLLNDRSAQQRARNNSAHDDNEAEQMLKLFPNAYVWTIAGEEGNLVTLNFKPNPDFQPSGLEAKVLSAMGGQLVIQRPEMRIVSLKGSLLEDVLIGWGIVGRLRQGGSILILHKQVAPNHWQITTSDVHINGKVLFFKSIGSDEDETRTDFKPSHAQNLQQAWDILKDIH